MTTSEALSRVLQMAEAGKWTRTPFGRTKDNKAIEQVTLLLKIERFKELAEKAKEPSK